MGELARFAFLTGAVYKSCTMQKLPPKEPIFSPGGGTRFFMLVALITITYWLSVALRPVTDAAVHAGYRAVGVEPPSARHSHP